MSSESAAADEIGAPSDAERDAGMSPVAAAVYRLLAPAVATVEVELIDVDWTGGTLQVIVDHPDGVTIDRLAEVNRLVSPILDQHDPVPGRYTLEVTSPGVERPLRRLDHYRRAIGEDVIVKTVPEVEPRRLKGRLESASEAELSLSVVEIDGVDLAEAEPRTVNLADIASARTVFDWGPTPKPGKGQGSKRTKGGKSGGKNKKPGKGGKQHRSGGSAPSGHSQPNTEQERGSR